MVLTIICSCLAVVQLSLGIVAANNDSTQNRKGVLMYEENIEEYDIYREKNNPFYYYCTGPNYLFSWVRLLIMGVSMGCLGLLIQLTPK